MSDKSKEQIEVLARAIIQAKGKILVCRDIRRSYYFFPGGHIEYGEDSKRALIREIKEELGVNIKKLSFIGGSEHLFVEDGVKHHEVNLIYQVSVEKLNTESKENHLRFYIFDKNQLARKNILPKILKKAVLKWLEDKKIFWVS